MVSAWVAFIATVATAGTATLRFMFPNVLFEPPTAFEAGYPTKFKQEELSWVTQM
jgi:hypothetical protein